MASDAGSSLQELYTAASALVRDGQFAPAISLCQDALSLQPDFPPLLGTLAEALGAEGRHEEAAACYKRIIELRPDLGLAYYNYANAMMVLGKLDEARKGFERAIARMPKDAAAHRALSGLKTYRADDPQIAALETLARGEAFLPDVDRAELHFALAKVETDLGHHDRAFAHLEDGNRIKRRLVNYDEEAELALLRQMAAEFTPEVVHAKSGLGEPSEVPVFVIGMPRSGTTLAERILASHSEVFGAGELSAFGEVAASGYAPRPLPFAVADLGTHELRDIGARYLARLIPKAPDARRIVDKLPANFRFVGLIRLALPNARIVHVRRDPLDTCFSCYSQMFVHNLEFTYDLAELGRYYKAYEALMAHWRLVLPPGAMLELDYEELVRDFEVQARRLIAFCGLEWDARCLRFHEAPGVVQTASAVQARKPLYVGSVGRAKRYEAHLAPLRAILEA